MMPSRAAHGMALGQSLRGRITRNPFAAAVDKTIPDMRDCIEEETEHDTVLIRQGWLPESGLHRLVVTCIVCDHRWTVNTTEAAIYGTDPRTEERMDDFVREWVLNSVAPLFCEIAETHCFSALQEAVLAEWLTHRLRDAGKDGMPAAQLVHEACDAGLGPVDVSDHLLRRMGFTEEWVPMTHIWVPKGTEWQLPIISLPEGHPLRTW